MCAKAHIGKLLLDLEEICMLRKEDTNEIRYRRLTQCR